MVKLKENESFESLFKRFKKQVADAGIMQDYKKHVEYVPPSLKRKLKSEAAQKRERKKKKYINPNEPL